MQWLVYPNPIRLLGPVKPGLAQIVQNLSRGLRTEPVTPADGQNPDQLGIHISCQVGLFCEDYRRIVALHDQDAPEVCDQLLACRQPGFVYDSPGTFNIFVQPTTLLVLADVRDTGAVEIPLQLESGVVRPPGGIRIDQMLHEVQGT